jgi:hypothetical protein
LALLRFASEQMVLLLKIHIYSELILKSMLKYSVPIVLLLTILIAACNRSDPQRMISPSVTWTYDGVNYSASSIQLSFQQQGNGFYEFTAWYEDASFTHTLTIALTNGVAAGSHTVQGYYIHYLIYDKAVQITDDIGFQVYTADVTDYNGNFVSGSFTANNAVGPALSGTFQDINTEM